MKTHLNTLYVSTDGAYVAREGECVLVRIEKETKLRMPVHHLAGIVCFGRTGVSASAMALCAERGVAITLLSRSGRLLAKIDGFTEGNVLLRRDQYRRADTDTGSAEIARAIVQAKIANSRAVLLRGLRDNPGAAGSESIKSAATSLASSLTALTPELPLDAVRGVEGEAAAAYFGVFDHLITVQKDQFQFRSRSRRPPTDSVNAMLSFSYALLTHDVRAACESVGLDPAVGFLHRDRPGRPGLALDLMEELRAYLCDRLVLTLINRKQVDAKGFEMEAAGAVRMNDATRKALLVAYQQRKQETIEHPFLGEKVTIGLIPHLQARLLARFIRRDLDAYPPFLSR
jgi:CRISPR-associated protein Cas1